MKPTLFLANFSRATMLLSLTLPGQPEPLSLEVEEASARGALDLEVVEVRPGHFQVEGSGHPYYVSVQPDFLCCCHSSVYGPPTCKHVVAVLLRVADPELRLEVERVTGGARARRKVADRARPGRDLGWPEAMARALRDPGREDLLALSRVLTDPALTSAEALALARACKSPFVINTLTRMPRVLESREVRAAIADNASHISTVARLMPYSDPQDFQPLFRGLLGTQEYKYALDVLEYSPASLISTLGRQDLLPLFQAEDADVRTRAMQALARVMEAEQVRGVALPEWVAGEPLFSLPEPVPSRRGRRR